MNWDQLFIEMAELVSKKSKDPSTKVGCVIVGEGNTVLSVGFNGFPRGVNEINSARWERPTKYDFVAHAEANCVFNAARNGVKLAGARAYVNWEPKPCVECAKALIQAGIVEIIGPNRTFLANRDWRFSHSDAMLVEAGVTTRICE
jgi:dCMP deaminase